MWATQKITPAHSAIHFPPKATTQVVANSLDARKNKIQIAPTLTIKKVTKRYVTALAPTRKSRSAFGLRKISSWSIWGSTSETEVETCQPRKESLSLLTNGGDSKQTSMISAMMLPITRTRCEKRAHLSVEVPALSFKAHSTMQTLMAPRGWLDNSFSRSTNWMSQLSKVAAAVADTTAMHTEEATDNPTPTQATATSDRLSKKCCQPPAEANDKKHKCSTFYARGFKIATKLSFSTCSSQDLLINLILS